MKETVETDCIECEKGRMVSRMIDVPGEFKGEKFTVQTKALVCESCNHIILEGTQMPEYMRQVANAYRKAHGDENNS